MSESEKAQKKIVTYLEEHEWKVYPDMFKDKDTVSLYKRYDTPTRCSCNSDKVGVQVTAHVGHWGNIPGAPVRLRPTIELKLAGELGTDKEWVEIHHWAFPNDEIEEVLECIPRLLSTWEFIANYDNEV